MKKFNIKQINWYPSYDNNLRGAYEKLAMIYFEDSYIYEFSDSEQKNIRNYLKCIQHRTQPNKFKYSANKNLSEKNIKNYENFNKILSLKNNKIIKNK